MCSRIDAATELTASQWERPACGERIDLPQGQFDYLVSFMDGLGGVPVDRLGGLNGDLRGALADGLQVVSNPNIGTFQQLPESAGIGTEAVGGLDRLPAQVRTLLTEDPTAFSIAMSEFSNQSRPDWLPDGAAAFGVEVPRTADYAALTDIVAAGDPQLRVGTDLDRSMIAQVAEMAAATQPDGTGSGLVGTWIDSDPPTDSTISSMLEVAASDRDDAQRRLIDRMLTDERLYRSVLEGVVESRPELVDAAPLPVDIAGIGPDRNSLGAMDIAALDKWMAEAGIPFADFRLHLMGASGYGWSE